MTTDKTYHAEATTLDGGYIERTFDGGGALRTACLFAQGIEEDGGTAYVTDETGETVDHWAGYRVAITPQGQLALGYNLTKTIMTSNSVVTKLRSLYHAKRTSSIRPHWPKI